MERSGVKKPPLAQKDKNEQNKIQKNFHLNLANVA
jgi:hypothetical protein